MLSLVIREALVLEKILPSRDQLGLIRQRFSMIQSACCMGGDVLKPASNRIAFSLEGGWRTGYGAGAILRMRPERPFVRCHAVCRPVERGLPEGVCELLSEKRKKAVDRIPRAA